MQEIRFVFFRALGNFSSFGFSALELSVGKTESAKICGCCGMKHNAPLNAVTFWILDLVVTKLGKKSKIQIERDQIVVLAIVRLSFARCQPLANSSQE